MKGPLLLDTHLKVPFLPTCLIPRLDGAKVKLTDKFLGLLQPHAESLLGMIRDRCFTQYLSPYMSVSLESMAASFGCSIENVGHPGYCLRSAHPPLTHIMRLQAETGVAKLIMNRQISARIDSQSKTLHETQTEKRAATYRKVCSWIDVFEAPMMHNHAYDCATRYWVWAHLTLIKCRPSLCGSAA